jgi:hypothetical protein
VSLIPNLDTKRIKCSAALFESFTIGKVNIIPVEEEVDVSQSWSSSFEEEKNYLPLSGNET